MDKWLGELGDKIDNQHWRKRSYNAWIAWEYLQRGVVGNYEPLEPIELSDLCGKPVDNIKRHTAEAFRKSRDTLRVKYPHG